jgi:hypothetical protein
VRRRKDEGRLRVEVEDLAIRRARGRARLYSELLLQECGALLIEMQRSGTAAVARVTPHQCAPALLVQRVEAERLLRVPDCIAERAILLEQVHETCKHLSCSLAETFPIGVDPLAGPAGKDVARIQASSPMQGATIAR